MDEIAMHADDPAETAGDLVTSAIFGEHGLGRPVIGSAGQHHRAAGAIRSSAYWRRHYRPSDDRGRGRRCGRP